MRRAQIAVLDAVARAPDLWKSFVLQGGLALRLGYDSPRGSDDLDFSAVADREEASSRRILSSFSRRLDESLREVAGSYGFTRFEVWQQALSLEMPVIQIAVGIAEGEETPPFPHRVKVEVALVEKVTQAVQKEVDGVPIRVPVLEDLVAGKLKSLLQQPVRGTVRSEDVFDVWYFVTHRLSEINLDVVRTALDEKTAGWETIRPITRSKFVDPSVRNHAKSNFAEVRELVDEDTSCPSFEEAFDSVLRLVERLNLPEDEAHLSG